MPTRSKIQGLPIFGILAILLVAVIPPLEFDLSAVPLVAGSGLAVCALICRHQHALVFVVAFGSAFLALSVFFSDDFRWPWHLLLPLVIASIAARSWKREVQLALGWNLGDTDSRSWVLAAGISVLATGALVVWAELAQPDLTMFLAMVPEGNLMVLIGSALAFALLNATMEELIWRGGIQSWLDASLGAWTAIAIQSLSFGALHWAGFPSGWSGVALATIYGFMLGWLRHRTNGLAAPIAAHILADLTIFTLVLGSF